MTGALGITDQIQRALDLKNGAASLPEPAQDEPISLLPMKEISEPPSTPWPPEVFPEPTRDPVAHLRDVLRPEPGVSTWFGTKAELRCIGSDRAGLPPKYSILDAGGRIRGHGGWAWAEAELKKMFGDDVGTWPAAEVLETVPRGQRRLVVAGYRGSSMPDFDARPDAYQRRELARNSHSQWARTTSAYRSENRHSTRLLRRVMISS